MFFATIPVAEAFEGEDVHCDECGVKLEWACYARAAYYCERCMAELAKQAETEAREYALEQCRITRPLPQYDPSREYRCTPEEYDAGDRESYTPNAHACYCRHECTNYDELIEGLDQQCELDQIYYLAIRDRIEELIEEALRRT
jgi:hypothetical protein